MNIKLIKAYQGHGAGEVIELSPDVAFDLWERSIAETLPEMDGGEKSPPDIPTEPVKVKRGKVVHK
jgi:hypothetical protein